MLFQQLLSMASQSIKEVTSRFTYCQCLKRSVEVMRTLKTQQGLFEVTPTPDLWWGTKEDRKAEHGIHEERISHRTKSNHSQC